MKLNSEKIEQVAVADLIPFVNNARTHSDAQITQLAAAIKEFGWGAPLLIDKDDGVIAGHARLLAAKKLKLERVPCVRLSHLSDAQRKALIIADNRIALSSDWDYDRLSVQLDELRDMAFDMSLLGFDAQELNNMIGTPNPAPLNEPTSASECLVEIRCTTDQFAHIKATLEEWQRDGLTINVS